jgi:hypothetical protein
VAGQYQESYRLEKTLFVIDEERKRFECELKRRQGWRFRALPFSSPKEGRCTSAITNEMSKKERTNKLIALYLHATWQTFRVVEEK